MYDVVIIGAGINGCSVAYELSCAKQNVLVVDMDRVAGGGSGAAGAFISPKFSKAGLLKELLHDAFLYSSEYYINNFPKYFTKTQLLHIAKDEKSAELLRYYKKHTSLKLENIPEQFLSTLCDDAKKMQYISLQSGIADAQNMCLAMVEGIEFVKQKVDNIVYENGSWVINGSYRAKNIVLATGAYNQIIKEEHIKLRGIWGHRIDIKTTTKNQYSLHQFVSISPNTEGVLAIGATHNVHYHPQSSKSAYDIQEGRDELLQKANKTLKLEDVEVLKDYTGLRSGSFDYIPMVGMVVDSKKTLALQGINFKTKKPSYDDYIYYPNLYMINGNGGYGFVLAPYLAKILKENILNAKKIDNSLLPARFFARWAKKL